MNLKQAKAVVDLVQCAVRMLTTLIDRDQGMAETAATGDAYVKAVEDVYKSVVEEA